MLDLGDGVQHGKQLDGSNRVDWRGIDGQVDGQIYCQIDLMEEVGRVDRQI